MKKKGYNWMKLFRIGPKQVPHYIMHTATERRASCTRRNGGVKNKGIAPKVMSEFNQLKGDV